MQKVIETSLGIFELRNELIDQNCTKFCLVADPGLDNKRVLNSLEAYDIPFVRFSQFSSNPTYEQVQDATQFFCQEQCNCIVAIGGGSTIDVAKCIKLFAPMQTGNYLEQPFNDSGIPLIVLPTTAGTGSEVTRFAVVTVNGVKRHILHDSMVPNIAILDPTLLDTLPEYQRKCGSLDAFSHAIESMWSLKATPSTIAFAQQSLRLMLANYRDFIFNYTHVAARNMLKASHLAGQAISLTHTTAAHALSFPLTTQYALPHGHAVALCLPTVMEFIMRNASDSIDPRGAGHLTQILKGIASIMHGVSISDAIVRLRIVLAELQLEVPKGLTLDDVDCLTDAVDLERIGYTPVPLSRDAVRELYVKILRIRR